MSGFSVDTGDADSVPLIYAAITLHRAVSPALCQFQLAQFNFMFQQFATSASVTDLHMFFFFTNR